MKIEYVTPYLDVTRLEAQNAILGASLGKKSSGEDINDEKNSYDWEWE